MTSTAFAAQVLGPDADESDLVPTGKGWGERAYPAPPRVNAHAKAAGPAKTNNGIFYHGGPVILGMTNAYYIWYGNWSGNSATTILTDFASSIGGSPYFNINTTYYDGSNVHVSNSVHYAGSTTDAYSQTAHLSRRRSPDRRLGRDQLREAAQGHERRLFRADVGRRQ